MITIKSQLDIVNARLPPQLTDYLTRIMNGIIRSIPSYNPDNDGHINLITYRDTDEKLCKLIGSRWADNMFEGVSFNPEFNCYHAVILANNQFSVSIIVPCETWLDSAIRERMVKEIM